MNNTNLSFHAGKDVLKHKKFMHLGFTLAEMMVVMLIMSIILAAMAPVMTTRARKMEEDRLSSTIWQWADNDTDIYFGYNPDELDVSNTQKVMIGQNTALGTDLARLIINTSDDLPDYIRFNKDATTYGRLYMNDTSLTLGSGQGSGGGAQSTSIGIGALVNNTGASNTAVGYNSLNLNTTGNSNTALGALVLEQNTTGSTNTGVGSFTLSDNTTGSNNTAIGNDALSVNRTGSDNTAVGTNALGSFMNAGLVCHSDDCRGGNTAIGVDSLSGTTGAVNNTAIGFRSLVELDNASTENTSIGVFSMQQFDRGNRNTAVGVRAMNGVTTGYNNVAVGNRALSTDEAGEFSQNIAIGREAMGESYASEENIAIGTEAMHLASGSNNIAIGNSSMQHMAASNNIAIGIGSMGSSMTRVNGNGSNIAIGQEALGAIINIGWSNIAIGGRAMGNVSHLGENNIAIGPNSCLGITNANSTICIGANSGPNSTWTTPEHIYLGSKSRFNEGDAVLEVHNIDDTMTSSGAPYGGMNGSGVVINGTLLVNGPIMSRFVHTGNSEVNELGILEVTDGGIGQRVRPTNTSFGDFLHSHPLYDYSMDKSWRSDRRLKYVGKEFTSGLDKIRQLKVFNYTFKKDEKKTPHVGVIAQDLQKVFPDAVKKGTDGFLQIRFEDMFYAVINAIKELDSRVTKLEQENKELKARIDRLESKLK